MNKIIIALLIIFTLGYVAFKAVEGVQDKQAARNAQIEKMLRDAQ